MIQGPPTPDCNCYVVRRSVNLVYEESTRAGAFGIKTIQVGDHLWYMGLRGGRTHLYDMDGEVGTIVEGDFVYLRSREYIQRTPEWIPPVVRTEEGDALERLKCQH